MAGMDNATLVRRLEEIRDELVEEGNFDQAFELLDALIEEIGKQT